MYNFLSGTLVEKALTSVTLDVGGIGFELAIPLSTSQKLPSVGTKIKLLTHFVVREDAQLLFGFMTEEERTIFRLLLSVSGIGPKMAITVLSGIDILDLKRAIVQGSVHVLTSISGIGRKTAERLIIELREKVILEDGQADRPIAKMEKNDILIQDSLMALVSLGYSKQNAKAAIEKALAQDKVATAKAEDLIRVSLKYI